MRRPIQLISIAILLASGCGKPWPRWKPVSTGRAGDLRQVGLIIPGSDPFWSHLNSKASGSKALIGLSETFYAGVGTLRLAVAQNQRMLDALTLYPLMPGRNPNGAVAEIWVSPDGLATRWRLAPDGNTVEWVRGENPRVIFLQSGRRAYIQATGLRQLPSLAVAIQLLKDSSKDEAREISAIVSRRWQVRRVYVRVQEVESIFDDDLFDPFCRPISQCN